MSEIELIKTLPVANQLGECVLWHPQEQALWWTDIIGKTLYRYDWHKETLEQWSVPERLCAFGFIENDAQRLIAAFESGFAYFSPRSGEVEWLARPEKGFTGIRMNDGRVDRQGRFWTGSMAEADPALDAEGNPALGSLYCLDKGECFSRESAIGISNSLCWSLESDVQYFADSTKQTIYRYRFDADAGVASQKEAFITTEGDIAPDGSCIDADNHLWNAQWSGGRVVRYRPDGSEDLRVELPVSQPTCVALGGPEMNLLFVTTAREELSEAQLAEQPDAGSVFVFRTPFAGVAESFYRP